MCGEDTKFSTVVVIIVNIIFLACSLVVTGAGIFGIIKAAEIEAKTTLLGDLGTTLTSGIVIGIGVALVLVAIIGMYATITKSKGCLTIYILLLAILTTAQIGGGVISIFFQEIVSDNVQTFIADKWNVSGDLKTASSFEEFFECCGWETLDDVPAPVLNNLSESVPCIDWFVEAQPCKDELFGLIDKVMVPLGGALAGFGGLQAVVLIIVFVLRCKGDYDDDDLTALSDF